MGEVVSGDPAVLDAAGVEMQAAVRRVAGPLHGYRRALAAFNAAPNDLGVTLRDGGVEVDGALEGLARLDRVPREFGEALLAVDGFPGGPVALGGVAGLEAGEGLPAGASAEAVRGWWARLSGGAKAQLMAEAPAWIGGLDGVPFADRGAVNRRVVAAHLEVLRGELAAAEEVHAENTDGWWDRRWPLDRDVERTGDAVDGPTGLRTRIAALEGWLADSRYTIIDYETAQDGRAVVAYGELAGATHVAVSVPGVTTTLADAHNLVANSKKLHDQMANLAPGSRPVTIAWLGYDTPGGDSNSLDDPADAVRIVEAAGLQRARDGAVELVGFQRLVRGEAPGALVTVVGHSYGSTTTGVAARERLEADRVALIGSPGAAAESVEEYTVAAQDVYAATTPDDGIRAVYDAQRGFDALRILLRDGIEDPQVPDDIGESSPLGHDPSSARFGAQIFTTDGASGHSEYYEEGTQSLKNLARIATGQQPELQGAR